MIVLFGGEKGGTGKSTLATNIAAYLAKSGQDVLLLDTDRQGSATNWAATRAADPSLAKVHSVAKTGDVNSAARDLAQRYKHVVIDAGGRDSRELRSAMLAADKLFVPIKASQFDLWTVETMNEIVGTSLGFNPNLKALALVSMAPTNPQINEAQEAAEMLKGFEHLMLCSAIIRERKAYRDATSQGRGVVELDNDKATAEIEALAAQVLA